jgi:methionine-gamma-lyase
MSPGRFTIATHSSREIESPSSPIAPPITLASVYRFPDLGTLQAASRGQKAAWSFYRRYGHANGRLLEEALAALEGGEDALACASGMSAVATLFETLARNGDRIVAARDIYGGSYAFLKTHLPRLGVDVRLVGLDRVAGEVLPGTRAVLIETISNPLIRCAPFEAVARACRKVGATLVVDNTFATPFLCRPLEWGADLVFHSGTKFLNGHGDATSGIIVGPRSMVAALRKHTILAGGVISPMDAWLTLRGLKTLGLRVERASENAEGVVRFLLRHRKVARVHYPPPVRYLKPRRGPMLSFEIRGGLRAADRFIRACQLIELVPSLGDVTTTSSHPARSSHAYLSESERSAMGVTDGLVRLSTGIEDLSDILEDLSRALAKA